MLFEVVVVDCQPECDRDEPVGKQPRTQLRREAQVTANCLFGDRSPLEEGDGNRRAERKPEEEINDEAGSGVADDRAEKRFRW